MGLIILAIIGIILSVTNVVLAVIEYNLSGTTGWLVATVFMITSLYREIEDLKKVK